MTHPDLNTALDAAFLSHLIHDGGHTALDEHISAGGTTTSYLAEWTAARDATARDRDITPELARRILDLPAKREGEGSTVRDYLTGLLQAFWNGNADGEYGMSGSSDWRYDLYDTLLEAGLIGAWRDGYGIGYRPDGTRHPEDQTRADRLITAAIAALSPIS